MKNIHFIGFVLWFTASFFCFRLFKGLYDWFGDVGVFLKIIILLVTAFTLLSGFYKTLLSFLLLVNKSHEKFNLISTIFSIIGLTGLIASYLYYGFNFAINKNEIFSQALIYTLGFFLAIILFKGFLLFPKSLIKR